MKIYVRYEGGESRYSTKGVDFMSKIHVPFLDNEKLERVENLLRESASEDERDSFIFDLFNLSSDERDYVRSIYPPLQQ